MANASVEKLKTLGLRHGEKAVMGLAATLCVMFLFLAATRSTIQLTPEDVRKAAESAQSNLNKKQNTEDILKLLEKNPNFEKLVDEQTKNKLNALAYKVPSPWTTPEPGAGLIRDTPELIAPTELFAYPGRGGILMYELKDGERIVDTSKDAAANQDDLPPRRKKRRQRGPGMAMGSGSGMGMAMMGGGPRSAQDTEKQKKEFELKKKQVQKALAGSDKEKADAADEAPKTEGPYKEMTKGLRWVAITGVVDYKKLRENYLTALKNKEVAYPHFKQLDVQRQVRQSDGTWSEWEDVDAARNREILDNLPEEDEEWAPDPVRIAALVDPLPFLKAGYWEKVHVASLVPKEKKEVAKPQMNMGSMEMGSSSMMGSASVMPEQMMMNQQAMMGSGSGMSMMEGAMGPGMGMGGMGGAAEDMSFMHNEEETLMVRSLDFTVEPDQVYRFQVRIVVFNPNFKREDISPGVDNKSVDLKGPWSEPTAEVTMPADVAAYALKKPPGAKDQLQFGVTRWDPSNGVMVYNKFDAGPGDVIGDMKPTDIPTSEGTGKKSKRIDYNTHQIVLDAMGGDKPVPKTIGTGAFEVPGMALLVRSDGTVAIRNQVYDSSDEVRKTIEESYKRELEESNKKRESSSRFGSSMMGGP